MSIEFKIITFWLGLTAVLYILTRISYMVDNGHLNWEYYKKESWLGVAYYGVFALGCYGIGFYLILRVAKWWFAQ